MKAHNQQAELDALQPRIWRCIRCRLCESRNRAVPGEGPARARVMLVGEAPGAREDIEGRPFVGLAGRLLNDMLRRAGLLREHVYITNSVKCRPPGNRAPLDDELKTCQESWLNRQIDLVNPRLVVLLGTTPVRQIFSHIDPAPLRGRIASRKPFVTPMFLSKLPPPRIREARIDSRAGRGSYLRQIWQFMLRPRLKLSLARTRELCSDLARPNRG